MKFLSYLKYSLCLSLIFVVGCINDPPEDYSVTTGWATNWQQNGGFEAKLKNSKGDNEEFIYDGMEIPSNMVFVQGGTFVMGRTQEDVMQDGNNIPKEVTVSSFWMDQTEITNLQYREYTDWVKRVFWEDGEGMYAYLYTHSLPDSTVWRSQLSFNEPMVTQYYRHPAYQDYPVVGVNWQQAVEYCDWRTDRVNERRIIESGALGKPEKAWKKWKEGYYDIGDLQEGYFTTQKYLKYKEYDLDNWEKGSKGLRRGVPDLSATQEDDPNARRKLRKIKIEDGLFTSPYRLPTEAEWEFAAVAGYNHTVTPDGNMHGKFYPWRSVDADNHIKDGSKSGRISLRQPYNKTANMPNVSRQQYGTFRDAGLIQAITDNATNENETKDGTYGGYSSIKYDHYMNTPSYRSISFEEMRAGQFLANFRHGRGDYAGVSPINNDLGTMTMPVGSFPPNDWGLYDMAGNVNEWVMDVYRPLTPLSSSDLNPFRGNLYKEIPRGDDGYVRMLEDLELEEAQALGLMDENGDYIYPAEPGSMVLINEQIDGSDDPIGDDEGDGFADENPYAIYKGRDIPNKESYQYENDRSTQSESRNDEDIDAYDFLSAKGSNPRTSPKRNYNRANNIDYRDGQGSLPLTPEYAGWGVYDYGKVTLINNYTRIYKGGSWQDDAYWLSPGSKRFLNEDLASSDIGFRCVVDHLGYVSGGYYKLGEEKDAERTKQLWKYKDGSYNNNFNQYLND